MRPRGAVRLTWALGLMLVACMPHLGPTLVPVCSEDFEVVCRAPTRAGNFGQGRDYEWEKMHSCPAKTDLSYRFCYTFAGAIDGRQVYRYRSFGGHRP